MILGVGETLLISLVGFCIVFVMLLFLIAILKIITAVVIRIEHRDAVPAAAVAAPTASAAPAAAAAAPAPTAQKEAPAPKPWDGKLQLIDCDEETAACIMAIISDETDIPLDELQFRRIAAL